jgi:Domain of unknown function (DUF4168)
MKSSTRTFPRVAAILGLALPLLFSGMALGQDGKTNEGSSGYSGASSAVDPGSVNDATIRQTAKAYLQVRQIVQNAQQALNNSGNDTVKQQQIVKQTESQKIAVVKAEGLQPEQYNHVIQLARADSNFRQKFLSYVDKESKSSS